MAQFMANLLNWILHDSAKLEDGNLLSTIILITN